jgi:hypothetical protein
MAVGMMHSTSRSKDELKRNLTSSSLPANLLQLVSLEHLEQIGLESMDSIAVLYYHSSTSANASAVLQEFSNLATAVQHNEVGLDFAVMAWSKPEVSLKELKLNACSLRPMLINQSTSCIQEGNLYLPLLVVYQGLSSNHEYNRRGQDEGYLDDVTKGYQFKVSLGAAMVVKSKEWESYIMRWIDDTQPIFGSVLTEATVKMQLQSSQILQLLK